MLELAQEKPDLIINIAASPFSYIHFDKRISVLSNNILKANAPLIYVNQIGAHLDIIFDGRSLAMNKSAEVLKELNAFDEDLQYVTLEHGDLQTTTAPQSVKLGETASIHQALLLGLKDYFAKSGFKKAVLGLSGGLDSAIVAALAVEALGAENVLAVLMPSVYSTTHSIKDAMDLVDNTGCQHLVLPIKDIAQSFEDTLQEAFIGLKADTTEENIQARTRGTLLMAISNKLGHILLNTSNKSEAAVGYGTLYGDMAGSLSVIGDVYKTQAYKLASYINREKEIIPINTIVKPPSAELRPDQKDSDSLPDYEMLDAILYQLIELEKSGSEVVKLGFDEQLVQRITKLVNNAEFKRFQAPPILRVSPKAFGSGRQMPLVAKFSY
jgi:NAD+ synthase (glutamine-hydrolysing)